MIPRIPPKNAPFDHNPLNADRDVKAPLPNIVELPEEDERAWFDEQAPQGHGSKAKQFTSIAFGTADAFANVAASWGLRTSLMLSFTTGAVSLINSVLESYGRAPLEENVAVNIVTLAVATAAASAAAAPILGAVHGTAVMGTQLLRQIINALCNGGHLPKDAKPKDVLLSSVANPRFKLLCDNLVTAGFTLMVMGKALWTALDGESFPSNLQPGHVNAASAFALHPTALGSGIVAGVAYLTACLGILSVESIVLSAPGKITLRGAMELPVRRSLAATQAFSAPVIGTRGMISVPVLVGASAALAALMATYKDDIHPLVPILINMGLVGLSFYTIADRWGHAKIMKEVSLPALKSLYWTAPPHQKAQYAQLLRDRAQQDLDRFTKPPVCDRIGDAVVTSMQCAASSAMATSFVGSLRSETVGLKLDFDGDSVGQLLTYGALCFVAASFLAAAMQRINPAGVPTPAISRGLREEERPEGKDRHRGVSRKVMPAMVGGALAGVAAASGALPLAAVGFSVISGFAIGSEVGTWAVNRLVARCRREPEEDPVVLPDRQNATFRRFDIQKSPDLELVVVGDGKEAIDADDALIWRAPPREAADSATVPVQHESKQYISAQEDDSSSEDEPMVNDHQRYELAVGLQNLDGGSRPALDPSWKGEAKGPIDVDSAQKNNSPSNDEPTVNGHGRDDSTVGHRNLDDGSRHALDPYWKIEI